MVKELKKGVGKLTDVKSHEETVQLLETIKSLEKGEKVNVIILSYGGNSLLWQEKCVFTFDTCRCGNANYNAISILRDLLQKHNPEGKWTRKKVESLIVFQSPDKKTEKVSDSTERLLIN
jgi:hypothetical protein